MKWSPAAITQLIAVSLERNPWAVRGKHDAPWEAIAEHLRQTDLAVSAEKCRDKMTKLMKAAIARRNAEQKRTGAGAPLPIIAPTQEAQQNLDRCAEVFPFVELFNNTAALGRL